MKINPVACPPKGPSPSGCAPSRPEDAVDQGSQSFAPAGLAETIFFIVIHHGPGGKENNFNLALNKFLNEALRARRQRGCLTIPGHDLPFLLGKYPNLKGLEITLGEEKVGGSCSRSETTKPLDFPGERDAREGPINRVVNHFTNLHFLKIDEASFVTDEGIASLEELPSLRDLILNNCRQLTQKGLATLGNLTNLSSLTLRRSHKIPAADFTVLKNLTRLASLSLLSCLKVTDSILAGVRGAPLQSLSLSACPEVEGGFFVGGDQFSAMTALDLRGCHKVTDSALQGLASIESIRSLDLTGCSKITNEGVRHLMGLSNLQHLCLSECTKITDKGLDGLSSLKYLDLTKCRGFSDQGIENLMGLRGLVELSLSDFARGLGSVDLFSSASHKSLSRLHLVRMALPSAKFESLTGLISLRDLSLMGCSQFDDQRLHAMKSLTLLRSLNLSATAVTDFGLQAITNFSKLESLDISFCKGVFNGRQSDSSEVWLDGLGALKGLRNLCLKSTSVTDAHLKRLMATTTLNLGELDFCPMLKQ